MLLLLLVATLLAPTVAIVEQISDVADDKSFMEKKLVKHLLSMQDGRELGRPVSNFSAPVDVAFGINLMQVLRVNEDGGQLITNLWTHYKWHDPSLAWNNSAIDVDIVRIPAEEIWTPDVHLFNYADDRMRQARSTLAVINASGHIDWIPTGIFKSACSIDTYPFPFDEQLCHMTFRSLSMDITLMTLTFVDGRESMSLDSYVPNPEWEIIENSAVRSIQVERHVMSASFYDLTFTIRLKRRSVFHRYVLVLPCVLLSLTAGVLFMLPPESPAKIQIGIFIFQGFFLLLNLLKNSTPPSGSRSPIIGLYYSASMIATTIVMFCCGFLVEVHFRADQKAPMSDQVRNIVIKRLARYLFIPIPTKSPLEMKRQRKAAQRALKEARKSTLLNNRSNASNANRNLFKDSSFGADESSVSKSKSHLFSKRRQSPLVHSATMASSKSRDGFDGIRAQMQEAEETAPQGVLGDLIELRKTFQRVAEKQATKEYTELVKHEWLIAIIVFDRIFFFTYLSYIIWSLFLLLPQEDI